MPYSLSLEYDDKKAFSGRYVLNRADITSTIICNLRKKTFSHFNILDKTEETLAILTSASCPANFDLIIKGEVFAVARGVNNLFFAFVIFLRHVKEFENGMLG